MKVSTLIFELALLLLCVFTAGCSSGGDVTASLNETLAPVVTQAPTISVPSTSTYFSRDSILTVSGLCNTGYTVRLSEDIVHEQICENSSYSFTITKLADGYYPIALTQFHPNYGMSRQSNLIWIRKTSITLPTIISPSGNPFYSGSETLTVTGGCETGATVTLENGVTGSTVCQNSTFSVSASKLAVGSFNVQVKQTDPAGNSAQIHFVWERQLLAVNPSAPQLIAGETTLLVPTGGSRSYTSTMETNNSGATYDALTFTYTAGPTGGVQDTVRFVDSLGLVVLVNINVISGVADHFEFPIANGDFQTTRIGTVTALPLQVKVADEFGNSVPNFPVVFSVTGGDAQLVGLPTRSTNSQGIAQIYVRMGYGSPRNTVGVKPATSVLPDVANSGNPTLTFNLYATSTNSGNIGTQVSVASNPSVTELHDFNNDGHMDIAVLNAGDPSIGLIYGRGNGLFNAQTKLTGLCSGPSSMTVNDFNSDTLMDFAVACSGSDRITLLLSVGDGTYHPPVHINLQTTETLPVAIASGDLNGDGHKDIVTLSAAYTVASVRLGSGTGTFGTHSEFAVGPGPSQLTIADFNNDMRNDIAVLNAGDGSVGLLANNNLGGFFPHYSLPAGAGPAALRSGDFNEDGFVDLAIINNVDSNLIILTNDQFGGFNVPLTYPAGLGPIAMATADLNGDTHTDIVVVSLDSSSLSTFIGNGDGSFLTLPDKDVLAGPIAVAARDFNHDMKADVVLASSGDQKIQTFVGQGNGGLGLQYTSDSNPRQTLLADLDKDGSQDIVIVEQGANKVSILKGNGLGLWSPMNILSNGTSPSAAMVNDFNNDGNQDIAVLHPAASMMRVYIGDGTGQYAPPVIYTTGAQPVDLIARDLNADGYLDIAVVNSSSNTVSVFANMGNGNFQNKVDFGVGSQPMNITAADLNHDHEIDLVVSNSVPGSISVLLSNGVFSFQPHIEIAAGSGSTNIVEGFFNSDNNVDIAVLNEAEGSVSVFLGIGNGSFTTPSSFSVGTPAYGLVILDYNGNSHADLAVVNGGLSSATVLIGSGNGLFNTTATIPMAQNASMISIGDFNNDGAVDFVTLDPNLANYKLWPGN